MGLGSDRRYVNLARRAAGKLGTSNGQIVSAILAQWQCELGAGDAYPPRRNNPGNLARGAAETIGARYSIEPGSNPQPGNPIVSFPSPEAGADAYGKLLAKLPRYADVRAAARRGDGRAYLQAIGRSGYGGALSCMLDVFAGEPIRGSGAGFGGGGLPAASGPKGTLVSAPGMDCTAAQLLGIDPGTAYDAALHARLSAKIRQIYKDRGYPTAAAEGSITGLATAIGKATAGKVTVGPLCSGLDIVGGDVAGALPAFGDLFQWVPSTVATLAVLAGIGILGYIGLRNLAEGLGEG